MNNALKNAIRSWSLRACISTKVFYISRGRVSKYSRSLSLSLIIGVFKSNLKNAKSNLNYNLKNTLITACALTYNTCYMYTIKKESLVLNS